MATEAQINANRRNSHKSTGPQTAEGKAAVSHNAVKHGLFAHEAVIRGEDRGQFDLHREAFLAELRPVGAVESMLAERIVSLSWRLRRAERMQNEAIDQKILEAGGGRAARLTRSLIPKGVRRTLADSGAMEHDLSLGRALAKDSLDAWFLDRLLLYERRIESSMFKTIGQLREFQLRRETEQAGPASCRDPLARASRGHLAHDLGRHSESDPSAAEQQSAEESPAARSCGDNLKKQSQFAPALMGTKSCAGKDYGDETRAGQRENKANQSDFAGRQEPAEGGQGCHQVLRAPEVTG